MSIAFIGIRNTKQNNTSEKKTSVAKTQAQVYKHKATSRVVAVERTQETNQRTNDKKIGFYMEKKKRKCVHQ